MNCTAECEFILTQKGSGSETSRRGILGIVSSSNAHLALQAQTNSSRNGKTSAPRGVHVLLYYFGTRRNLQTTRFRIFVYRIVMGQKSQGKMSPGCRHPKHGQLLSLRVRRIHRLKRHHKMHHSVRNAASQPERHRNRHRHQLRHRREVPRCLGDHQ